MCAGQSSDLKQAWVKAMKSKALIPLVLGLLVGLVAVKFGIDAIKKAQAKPGDMVTTVVARQDIVASDAITAEMVEVVQTPRTPLVPAGSFQSLDQLVGRVASKSIPQGSVIGPQSVAPEGTLPGIRERIKEGYRAVSVKIDEVTGVAGQINPGDLVDVIVVMQVNRNGRDETVSRIILQRVEVAAVGRHLGSPQGETEGPTKLARSITLLIRDVDVPKFHLAQIQGKLTLAMRGSDDRLIEDAGLTKTSELTGEPDENPVQTPPAINGPPTVADRLRNMWTPESPANGPQGPGFMVTVFNGPLSADGAAAIQRITYANRRSMQVLQVTSGRSNMGSAPGPDSAESIMRPGPPTSTEEAGENGYVLPRTGAVPGPQDREIPEE